MRKVLVCLLVGFTIFSAQAQDVKLEKPIEFNYSNLREVPLLYDTFTTNEIWIKAALDNSESELIDLFRLYSDIDVSENASSKILDYKKNNITPGYGFHSRARKEFYRTLSKDGEMLIAFRAVGKTIYIRYVKYEYIKSRDIKSCPVSRKRQRALGIRHRDSRGCFKVSELEVFKKYKSPILNLTECANKYNLFGYKEFTSVESKKDEKFRCEFSLGNAIVLAENN